MKKMEEKKNILDEAFKNFLTKSESCASKEQSKGKEWKPDVIVIGPGGKNTYIEMGALLKLEKEGYLREVKHYIGCSSGAVIATLLVIGCSVEEIITETLKMNMLQDIMDIDSLQDVVKEDKSKVENALREKIRGKIGRDPTFEQLYMATGIKLTIVVHNTTKDRPEYMNYITEPNLSCITAVMMSKAIPIIQRRTYKGYEYIDGAFGNPYPVDVVDNGENEILGLYVRNENQGKSHMINFLYRIAYASLNQLRTRIIKHSSDKCKHLGFTANIKDEITNKVKSQMVKDGYEQTGEFIAKVKNPEKYKILLEEGEEIPFEENEPLIDFSSNLTS